MRRTVMHFVVAIMTFTLGITLGFLGRSFILGSEGTPAETLPVRVGVALPVPQEACEVHGVPLFKEQVPILYGYAPHAFPYETRRDYYQARKQFPHAARWSYAGCVLEDKWFEEVNVCPKCREAQASWAATPIPKK